MTPSHAAIIALAASSSVQALRAGPAQVAIIRECRSMALQRGGGGVGSAVTRRVSETLFIYYIAPKRTGG